MRLFLGILNFNLLKLGKIQYSEVSINAIVWVKNKFKYGTINTTQIICILYYKKIRYSFWIKFGKTVCMEKYKCRYLLKNNSISHFDDEVHVYTFHCSYEWKPVS